MAMMGMVFASARSSARMALVAVSPSITGIRKFLFSLAGRKFDHMAKAQGKKYSFVFVRSDGEQLKKITRIVEEKRIAPPVDSHHFNIDDINTALQLVKNGNANGKVVIRF